MSDPMTFPSLQAAYEWMDEQTRKANAVLSDEQKAISYGDYWIRFWAEAGKPVMTVFCGKVHTLKECEDQLRDIGGPAEEIRSEMDSIKGSHARGYLFSTTWSDLRLDGEQGDVHRANVWPLDKRTFDALRTVEFDAYSPELPERVAAKVDSLLAGYRTWLLSAGSAF